MLQSPSLSFRRSALFACLVTASTVAFPGVAFAQKSVPSSEAQTAQAPAKNESAHHTDWRTIGAITAFSVAGLSLGTLVYVEVHGSGIEDAGYDSYRSGLTANQDACTSAAHGVVVNVPGADSPAQVNSKCSEVSTLNVIGITSVVLAVVGVGVGTTLLLTRPSAPAHAAVPAPRWAFTPVIGARSASAWVSYRF